MKLLVFLVVLATAHGWKVLGNATAETRSGEAPIPSAKSSLASRSHGALAADTCLMFFRDFGDAPEGFPAYPSVSTAHFPSCPEPGPPGTQEIECGSPSSSAPAVTGHVVHLVGFDIGIPFWLGCGPHPSNSDAGDGESTAKTSAGSATSACGSIAVDCFEPGPAGMSFGQDECLGDTDAGVSGPIQLEACGLASFRLRATVCPALPLTAYLNVLVDWNQDGDWNDNVACVSALQCVREWAVKNEQLALTPGCSEHITPVFPVGPRQGPAWMRVTITNTPVHEGFPWSGSVGSVNGDFAGGETEDYLVTIAPSTVDVETAPPTARLWLALPRPNPSHEASIIRYGLTRTGPVRIAVFDIVGRRVRTLLSDVKPGGDHALTWDGTDDSGALAPHGVYVIRLEAEHRLLTQRLTRVR
jgi:FlgD Ig-like domain/GEVED domain